MTDTARKIAQAIENFIASPQATQDYRGAALSAAPPPPAVNVTAGKIVTALGLLASAVKAGETWTERCQKALQEALDAVRLLAAAPPAVMPGREHARCTVCDAPHPWHESTCPALQSDGWQPPEGEFFSEPDHYRVVFRPKGAGNFCGADVVVAVTSTGSGDEKRWCTRIAEALNIPAAQALVAEERQKS